jgi:hypothetical protein
MLINRSKSETYEKLLEPSRFKVIEPDGLAPVQLEPKEYYGHSEPPSVQFIKSNKFIYMIFKIQFQLRRNTLSPLQNPGV